MGWYADLVERNQSDEWIQDTFVSNIVQILAEERLAFQVFRPESILHITGY